MKASKKAVARFATPVVAAMMVSVAALTVGSVTATGQDADPSNTAVSRLDDYIYARQQLMDINEADMPPIDRAAAGEDVDLDFVKSLAFEISTVLSIAPHLFNSASKPEPSTDGSPPSSNALPAVWDDFDAFYDRMIEASNLAYKASQAPDIETFRMLAKEMRAGCDGCHNDFMFTYDPSTAQ